MTSNTSPKKPDWFALIEKDAPSAQVRKVEKKLPAALAIMALSMVALGGFFASGSIKIDSSPTSKIASESLNAASSNQGAETAGELPVASSQSINRIGDPTLNGGGDDDNDNDDNDDDEDDEDDYEDD